CSARAACVPTGARSTPCTCSRSRSRRSRRARGITTRSARPFPPSRRSGRWTRATARSRKSNGAAGVTVFGITTQALFGQLLIGLINGAFYAMLSLGLSVIFGLLNIINFAHGAQYMMGAFVAYFALQWAGLGYWPSLLIAPVVVGLFGVLLERTMLKRL